MICERHFEIASSSLHLTESIFSKLELPQLIRFISICDLLWSFGVAFAMGQYWLAKTPNYITQWSGWRITSKNPSPFRGTLGHKLKAPNGLRG